MHRRIILITLTLASCAFAQEWSRFRGPNGAGVAGQINIPLQFTEKDYLWKIALPGPGHSSPVLWGDRIFLTCCDPQTATRIILCLSAADGGTLWKREYESKSFRQHGDNSFAASSPAADADQVYVCWHVPESYVLVVLDHSGKEVWKADLGPFKSIHGSGGSPIVCGDMVILANDQEDGPSFVIALDRKTGRVRWKLDRKSQFAAYSTPCIYQPAGQAPQAVLASRTEGICGIDAASGKLLWQVKDAFDKRVVASPIVAGDLIIGQCGEGPSGRVTVAVRPGQGNQPAKIAWKFSQRSPYVPTPVCQGDRVFCWSDTGTVTCLRLDTGGILWQDRVDGAFYSSPIIVGGRLYCISKRSEMFIVGTGEKFELLAHPAGRGLLRHTGGREREDVYQDIEAAFVRRASEPHTAYFVFRIA